MANPWTDADWPYLRLPDHIALQEQGSRRIDNKTHAWIADPAEGFVPATIEIEEGEELTLRLPNGEQKKLKRSECQEINPAKFEKTEDMSNLTFLNEASVLHNLRQRYHSMMIYTYSGLFCVVINPYKALPIYSDEVAHRYLNRRRTECPPHLFAVSDEAFRNMMSDGGNQSMLITGESGAGKTENTKKVIAYFAKIGGAAGPGGADKDAAKKSNASLEDQVVQANPAIEAFGNATTVRNYNSSRFGKFIRIHFNKKAKLVGGDISHYLLEKSRVIKQAPGERSYHIFYQLMTQKKLRESFLLEEDIRTYKFVSQAEITVPCIDDVVEFKATDEAFDVMGFTAKEKIDLYRACSAIMHLGNCEWKQRPREEQAEAADMSSPTKACKLWGINEEQFVGALVRPTVKVGTEWVAKGQTVQQVDWAVGALSKAIYARMFAWLIGRCNRTLRPEDMVSDFHIGVLDIAGFEIFDRNSFEQLWINFVNEKLQQFFNHHMFILEQEEYKREGIEWTFIDFGLDLQACIELIEKPLGIVSMLDEECIVPKASDMTYVEKLCNQHVGKHPNFQKAKPPKGKEAPAHFAIVHYAGTVRYNAEAWLEKNKDPLNDSAVAVLKTAEKGSLISEIWQDYLTDVDREQDALRGKQQQAPGRKGKAASFLTVSTMYRESLTSLMTMLHSTHPHFIRCIIPNEKKQSGVIDAALVLNQLTCNGVLEGIRICRKGFPNRMPYEEFRYRYAILASHEAQDKANPKKAGAAMLKKLSSASRINVDNYKCGATKVFFRAGMLARMEEMRDEALAQVVLLLQAQCRAYLGRCSLATHRRRIDAAALIQTNVRSWIALRGWAWYKLYCKLKPMLGGLRSNEEVKALEKRIKDMEEEKKVDNTKRKELEESLRKKIEEWEDERRRADLEKAQHELHARKLTEALDKLKDETTRAEQLDKKAGDLARELERERKQAEERERRSALERDEERRRHEREVLELKTEVSQAEAERVKLLAQRKQQELSLSAALDDKEVAEGRVARLEDEVRRLRSELEVTEERLIEERRTKDDSSKARKKLEAEIRALKEQLDTLRTERSLMDSEAKRRDEQIAELRQRSDHDANLVARLQAHVRQMIERIEQLEEELEQERRARARIEKTRIEVQQELDRVVEHAAAADGQLNAQRHLNKTRQQEVATLQRELEKKALWHETNIADLCSMQHHTLTRLRHLASQASSLESEAANVVKMGRTVSQSILNSQKKHNSYYGWGGDNENDAHDQILLNSASTAADTASLVDSAN